jgi:quercetin dioxygenase-like cupin family protein
MKKKKKKAPNGTPNPTVLQNAEEARPNVIPQAPRPELGEHQVRERAWLTVVEGSVRIEAGDRVVEANPATLVTFDPGERHSVATDGGARILLILSRWPSEGHYPET